MNPSPTLTAEPRPTTTGWRRWRDRLLLNEDLNFLVTNRVPRRAATRFAGWFSKLQSPLLAQVSIAVWRLFTELDLSDAKQKRFASLHDCFTRELQAGARPFDTRPDVIASPCDAIVGEHGVVERGRLWQAKGMDYAAADLFGDPARAAVFEGGRYVTLRLTSAMYHRFHAPADATIEHVSYRSGDTWNVNPIALARVRDLFCRNERAAIRMRLPDGRPLALVPVAAILVASIRLHCIDVARQLRRCERNEWPLDHRVRKGDELGWFEHGSTIIAFAPPGFEFDPRIERGLRLRAGEALLAQAAATPSPACGRGWG